MEQWLRESPDAEHHLRVAERLAGRVRMSRMQGHRRRRRQSLGHDAGVRELRRGENRAGVSRTWRSTRSPTNTRASRRRRSSRGRTSSSGCAPSSAISASRWIIHRTPRSPTTSDGWSKICPRLYVWDYTTDFAHYVQPHPNWFVLGPNLRFFQQHNVRGVFEQGAYQSHGSEMAELRAWVLAQLLWNPKQDDRALDHRVSARLLRRRWRRCPSAVTST